MFVIDDSAEPVDYITIDTQSVLIEVSSVGADYVAAFELLGAANTVLIRNRDYETLPRHALAMGRDEFHVLALIDDRRTASEVAGASHLEEVTVISILGKFCQAKVLLATADGRAGAARRRRAARPPRQRVGRGLQDRRGVPPPAAEPATPPPRCRRGPPPNRRRRRRRRAGRSAARRRTGAAALAAPVGEPGGPPELGARRQRPRLGLRPRARHAPRRARRPPDSAPPAVADPGLPPARRSRAARGAPAGETESPAGDWSW